MKGGIKMDTIAIYLITITTDAFTDNIHIMAAILYGILFGGISYLLYIAMGIDIEPHDDYRKPIEKETVPIQHRISYQLIAYILSLVIIVLIDSKLAIYFTIATTASILILYIGDHTVSNKDYSSKSS